VVPTLSPGDLPSEAAVRAVDLELGDAASLEEARQSRIREAAYAAYERRGGEPGHESEDWLEAEQTVDAELAARPPK
jgi:hypothetical protein